MVNTYLVVYTDADFVVTGMNASFEEAKQYYVGNYFTFGTCAENEHKKQCVAIFQYDEWKHKVLKYCLENNIVVLKFDDEMKAMYFKNVNYTENHMCTYEDIKETMDAPRGYTFGDLYGNGWDKPIYETKEKAVQAAKDYFKTSSGQFVEIGWCILKNNQLNVINTERLEF